MRTLSLLKSLHENTKYKVQGRDTTSSKCNSERGLREGDATSPVLFNLHHAQVMTKLTDTRSSKSQGYAGIQWQWTPGCSLPANDTKKAYGNSANESKRVTETLFADDTTLLGIERENDRARDITVES